MNLKKILKIFKQKESFLKTIAGAIFIIILGFLLINYFTRKGKTIPSINIGDEGQLPTKYIVQKNENLWKISEKYYGTGYNWVDIAKENNIPNADIIEEGKELIIPDVEPRFPQITLSPISDQNKQKITPTPSPFIDEKKVHKVEKGENLWKISEKYFSSGYNWVDIAKENNLVNPNLIEVGQELKIPVVEPKTITSILSAAQTNKSAISETTYKVVQGDNLWEIAVRAYGDGYKWVEIASENNLVNPNLIHSGNTLIIPR